MLWWLKNLQLERKPEADVFNHGKLNTDIIYMFTLELLVAFIIMGYTIVSLFLMDSR